MPIAEARLVKHPLDTQLLPSAAADHMLVTVEGGALGALVTARCTVSRSKDSSAGGTSRERLRVRPDRYCTLTTGARSSSTKRRGWTRVKLRWSSGCLAAGQRCSAKQSVSASAGKGQWVRWRARQGRLVYFGDGDGHQRLVTPSQTRALGVTTLAYASFLCLCPRQLSSAVRRSKNGRRAVSRAHPARSKAPCVSKYVRIEHPHLCTLQPA